MSSRLGAEIRAVSLDAAGTLLVPRVSVAEVYQAFAQAHGGRRSREAIAHALPAAMRSLRPLRAMDRRWHAYWSAVIEVVTGVDAPALVDRLWAHYADPAAWRLGDGAMDALASLRARGLGIAVVSNWDERLRATLDGLGVLAQIDVVVVSGELGIEKPDPRIFAAACAALGIAPSELVHVGDDDDDDVAGARGAGCHALHVTRDLGGLAALAELG